QGKTQSRCITKCSSKDSAWFLTNSERNARRSRAAARQLVCGRWGADRLPASPGSRAAIGALLLGDPTGRGTSPPHSPPRPSAIPEFGTADRKQTAEPHSESLRRRKPCPAP